MKTNFQTYPLGELIAELGGYYAGIVRGENGAPDYHLFVAPEDAAKDGVTWGKFAVFIQSAVHVNDGAINTSAMISAGECPAAEACHAYRGNGFDDWYLPAKAELNVCYANARFGAHQQ